METIVYPYQTSERNILVLVIGILLLAITCPILCTLAMLPVTFILTPSLLVDAQNWPMLLGICGFALFVLLLVGMGVVGIYAGLSRAEAILTPDAFSYGLRGRLTTIRLAEISRITAKTEIFSEELDWVVTIESIHQQKIYFRPAGGLFRRTYRGNFDYPAILRDLVLRVPATAQVDESVRHFAETGKII